MNIDLEQIKRFAEMAHFGQLDKAGKPYILHPFHVGDSLIQYGPIAQAVGYLHDVVEDTQIPLSVIRFFFGQEIAEAVLSVTRLNPEYEHRLGFKVEKKETYRQFVIRSSKNQIGKLVKIADIQHNNSPERMGALLEKDRGISKRYEEALDFLLNGKF